MNWYVDAMRSLPGPAAGNAQKKKAAIMSCHVKAMRSPPGPAEGNKQEILPLFPTAGQGRNPMAFAYLSTKLALR
eukprot:245931-Pelagomonas_calceolata.AAC.2